uniref:Heparanase n=1 Tax=Photinus pyralis TaxID=7054 RepID=A0A1Y1N3N1_PHOPY
MGETMYHHQSSTGAVLKCSFSINLLLYTMVVLLTIVSTGTPPEQVVHVILKLDEENTPFRKTNNMFLSTALDSVLIAHGFQNFNMSDPKLVKLMKPLAPGYLRIGGNMADRLWFDPSGKFVSKTQQVVESDGGACANEEIDCDVYDRPNFTMTAKEWTQLNSLAKKAGLTILFDINCLIRFPNGSWNSKNAEELIKFSADRNFSIIWQLGNEPNAFRHVFDYEVNATQLAKDFAKLRSILNRYPIYRKSELVGPDTTRPIIKRNASMAYLHEFLLHGKNVINAVTWHQYYFNGRNASISQFLDPEVFNLLQTQIGYIKDIVKSAGATSKPIWLGETSSAYGGGAPGLSNSFVATFMWLDKLGIAARNGLDVVVRQTLFGSNYSLLDENLQPLPDWWVSVIYKRIVDSRVIPCYPTSSTTVRIYCHCTKKRIFSFYSPFVVVFGLNVKKSPMQIKIQGYQGYVWEYSLTSKGSLVSKDILLNGEKLSLANDGTLPDLDPVLVNAHPYLQMRPYSLTFWIIPLHTSSCPI